MINTPYNELLKKAGFTKVEVTAVAKEAAEPHFETLLASGIKAGK